MFCSQILVYHSHPKSPYSFFIYSLMPIISHAHPQLYHPSPHSPIIIPTTFSLSSSTPYVSTPSSLGRGSGSGGFLLQHSGEPHALRTSRNVVASAFTAASSSTGTGFKSSARLACYGSSAAVTSRTMSADEALHAPMKAAAAGSTPTPGRCSWTCSMAEGAARHGGAARSAGRLDQLRGPPTKPLISSSSIVVA